MSKRSGKLRRAGANWRILVHHVLPGRGGYSDHAHHIQDDRWGEGDSNGEHSSTRVLPHTEFDELVVGQFLHIEQLDTGLWWMNIAGVTVHVKADRDGQPLRVSVSGPLDYDEPIEGCEYQLTWTDLPDPPTGGEW